MGRQGSVIHTWTDSERGRLAEAVATLSTLREHYKKQTGGVDAWWDAVAGRLVPDLLVTGKAARREWGKIEARSAQNGAKPLTDMAKVLTILRCMCAELGIDLTEFDT